MQTRRALRVADRLRSAMVGLLARLDPAVLLIPLIGMVAVWPFLTQSLPSTDDGALHMRRLAEIDRCLRHGVLPLRWAPDFGHGYGYPFFNYYASLSSYVAEFWHLLGLNIPQAVAAATVLAVWVSGWGTYLLGSAIYGRTGAGRKGGLVAATAYMYAPYQFYDSAYRGNLAEMWALALLPWVLWAGRRAVIPRVVRRGSLPSPGGRWAAIVPLAVAYAALVYTHNVYALISSPVLALYLLWLWWTEGRPALAGAVSVPCTCRQDPSDSALWKARLRRSGLLALARLVAGGALGLALSAFFWLPAFGERGWTRFSTGLVDYRTYFLSARELLAAPPQVDLSLLNYYPPRSLNWGMLVLIVAGLVWFVGKLLRRLGVRALRGGDGWRAWKPALQEVGVFLVVFVGAAFLTVRASDLLWRTVPLLGYALIPWRFLGIASLAGSVVAGAVIALLPDRSALRSPAVLGACVAIALVVAAAVPWTYAAPVGQRTEYGVAEIVGWEYSSKLIGTTAKNEFLPIWSPRLPPEPADPAVLTEADPTIARLDASSLPDGARVILAEYRLMRADLVIDTPRAFRALYKQLYFPGWQVTVDGRRVAPVATAPYGLLGFEVPEGRHRVVVRPATTPLRLTGSVMSVLAAIAMLGSVVFSLRRRAETLPADPEPVDNGFTGRYNPLNQRSSAFVGVPIGLLRSHWIAIAVLCIMLLFLKEGWIDRTENLFRARRFDPGGDARVPAAQVETAVQYGDAFTLHGYRLPRRPVVAGEPLRVDLYLSARRPPEARPAGENAYLAYARLVDDEGRLWSLSYNGAPEGHRPPPATTIWPTDAYGHWAYLAYTLPGTPPGTYWIEVGLFERDTWRGLNVLDDAGRIVGLSTRIGPVEIARPHTRPRTPPDVETLGIERPSQALAGPDLRYLGSTMDAAPRRAGDELRLTLFWQAARQPQADYGLRLALRGGESVLVLGERLPLGRHEHPTGAWRDGEIVRSPHRLRVPADAPAGAYVVEATVIDMLRTAAAGQPVAAPIVVAEGVLEPTDRQMALPGAVRRRVDADLGARVALLGYDLPGRDLPIGDAEIRVAPGETLPVTLYWQAQREMAVSYKVFVQLVGAGTHSVPVGVLAQSDAIPAHWQRPTTGWVPGEVIADEHAIEIPADAPPGGYTLIAGMYDEGTLQRLVVLDAHTEPTSVGVGPGTAIGDHVTLEGVVVE
jgi:hypothetical protein